MGRSPFITRELSSQSRAKQRRSTRIDYITPIVLAGRDATGQTFREETQTSVVNLHGAKVLTNYQVMVGMIVSLEILCTGREGKAVCVQVYDPAPGETIHHIAVQLVQPGNIWCVENPPPDWEAVEAELGGAHQPAAPASPKTPVAVARPATPVSPLTVAAIGPVDAGAQFTDFEKRAARLMDSVLEILRLQADAAVRNSVQEIQKHMESIGAAAESRLRETAEQAGEGLETTLETFRTEGMGEVVRQSLQGFERQLDDLTRQMETRFVQRLEQALAKFETNMNSVQQQQRSQAADAEARITRAAEQAVAKIESSRQSLQQLQEKMTTQGEAEIARRSEEASAAFEASLRNTQEKHQKQAAEAGARILHAAEQALAGIEKSQERQKAQSAEVEARISRATEQALADFDAALQTFRSDVGDELAARRDEAVKSAEQDLRTRVAALLSNIITLPGVQPPAEKAAPPKPGK